MRSYPEPSSPQQLTCRAVRGQAVTTVPVLSGMVTVSGYCCWVSDCQRCFIGVCSRAFEDDVGVVHLQVAGHQPPDCATKPEPAVHTSFPSTA